MIDKNGFRANVGIILINAQQQVFWGRRVGNQNAWQFPQGGMKEAETDEQAMYRELYEELGLLPQHVSVLDRVRPWIYYRLPRHLRRYRSKPLCIGQKQKWFLLQLMTTDGHIALDRSEKPEFDRFQWVSVDHALSNIVDFKRKAYRRAVRHLAAHFPTQASSGEQHGAG